MKKIIPIFTLCVSLCVIILSAIGFITIAITLKTPQLKLISVPTAVTGLVASAVCTPLAYLFRRDILCVIAFWIDLAAFILSAVAVALWIIFI